jgi:hypothetical protein
MKRLIGAAAAVFSLAGCVAVPVYSEPAYPAYAPGYYYGPPAATFSFGYHRDRYNRGYGTRHGPRHGPRRGDRD